MVAVVPQTTFFYLLIKTYPRATLPLSGMTTVMLMTFTILVMVLASTPLVFSGVEGAGADAKPVRGPAIPIFAIFTIGLVTAGIYELLKKNMQAKGIEKTQLRYLLLGVSTMFALLIGLVFVNVAFFDNTRYVIYAPLFTLPFVSLTAYTIIRHRLMDIRAAIFRGLSLSILVGAVLSIYALLLVFAVPLVAEATGLRADMLAVAAALVTIPLARYVQQTLTRLTDRFLFQGKPDYQRELVVLSQRLSSTINIEDVTDTVVAALGGLIRIRSAIIFLKNPSTQELEPQATAGKPPVHFHLDKDHPLVEYLHHTAGPVVKDELPLLRERERSLPRIARFEEVESAMTWLDAAVVLPLFVKRQLTGLIALGDKLSGEPYLQDDITFLAALAPQAATALENARLYKESLEFGQRLKIEVERATYKLAVANEQLRNLDKAKSEFLSVASHQLYTPLTALRGYLSMLREGEFGRIAKPQQPVIVILEQSAERLIELIRELLDISRIESGRLELNLEALDLVQMTEILVKDLLPNAMRKQLDLIFDPPAQLLPPVVGDAQRLRQVMLNFVDNAIKYTDRGTVTVTLSREGDEVVFAVTDTGVGLTAEEIDQLFTKFTRVGGATRYHTEGSGLGLYVAKQIVQEHRGSVRVTSPGKGKGATFAMRLPVQGSPRSHKIGEKATVAIRAAETQKVPERAGAR